jgi:hypothetical protein
MPGKINEIQKMKWTVIDEYKTRIGVKAPEWFTGR